MSKDFQYEAQTAESPFELIERDIDLYGDDFWKDMDESEFLLNYGCSKKDFLFYYSVDFNLYTHERLVFARSANVAFTEQSLEKVVEDFQQETIKHLAAKKVSGENTASKRRAAANIQLRTSVKPSEVRKNIAKKAATQTPKPTKKTRRQPYPASQPNQLTNAGQEAAKKNFTAYKKNLLKLNRSSYAKKFHNLREKALKNAIANAGVKWGSSEWVELVEKFFPGANLAVTSDSEAPTVDSTSEETVDSKQKPTQNTEDTSASTENSDQSTDLSAANQVAPETENSKPAKEDTVSLNEAPTSNSNSQAPIDTTSTIEGGSEAVVASLSDTPATEMLDSFNQKAEESNQALQSDVEKAQKSMPVIPAPTGLAPRTDDKTPADEVKPETPQAPESFEAEKAAQQVAPEEPQIPSFNIRQDLPSPVIGNENAEDADPESMATEAMAQIQLETDSIPSEIGLAPAVPLNGASDPGITQNSQQEAEQLAQESAAAAQTYADRDFGEQNILPDPDDSLLSAENDLQMQAVSIKTKGMDVPEVPGELVAEVDKMMGTKMQPRIQQEQAAFQTQTEAQQQESDQARAEADTEIAQLQTDAIAEQEAEKQLAAGELQAKKDSYQQEVGQLQQDFEGEVTERAAESNSQINAERQSGEAQAQQHFADAEQKAQTEKTKAEAEAEKQKEEKKNEKKGLLGAIKGAVSSVVNAIKDAVNSIFEGLRNLVKGFFEAAKNLAMKAIDFATKTITGLIKVFGEVLKGLVTVLLAAFPELQEKLLAKIDQIVTAAIERVNALAQKLKSAVTATLDFLSAIIDMALAFVQEVYNIAFTAIGMIVRGEFAELGSYIFKSAVSLIIGTLKQFLALLGIDTETLDKIIEDPIMFFKNLIESVKGGIRNFVGNIKKHLTNGLAGWLFGIMSSAGIQLPTSFSLKGVIFLVLQVLNLTWGSVRGMIIKQLGPKGEAMMGRVEQVVDVVKDIALRGPLAIVDHIKDFVGSLKETLIGSIIEWVRNTVIAKAIAKLIIYFNPAGAIIAVIEGIYNTIMFLKEHWEQIKDFCMAVMTSIKEVAIGNIDSAKTWVENSLGKAIPVTLGFLARLIGLGGISEKIKKIIKKIRKPIDKALKKVVGFVVKKAKKIGGKLMGRGKSKTIDKDKDDIKKSVDKSKPWWKIRNPFKTKLKEDHTIFFKGGEKNAVLMIASDPTPAFEFLKKAKEDPKNKETVNKAGHIASKIIAITKKLCKTLPDKEKQKLIQLQENEIEKFGEILKGLVGVTEIEPEVKIITPKGKNEPEIKISEWKLFNPLSKTKEIGGWQLFMDRVKRAELDNPEFLHYCAEYFLAMQNPYGKNALDIEGKLDKVVAYLKNISAANKRMSDGGKANPIFNLWSGAKKQAIIDADKHGGVALETSVLGGLFDGLEFDLPKGSWEGELWTKLSKLYAENIMGKVRIHQYRGLRGKSVFNQTEKKQILNDVRRGRLDAEVFLYANRGEFKGWIDHKEPVPYYGAEDDKARKPVKTMKLTEFTALPIWEFEDRTEKKGGFWAGKADGGKTTKKYKGKPREVKRGKNW